MDIMRIAMLVYEELKKYVPYDTGNMANNALKIEQVSANEVKIYIDSSIAPYAVYTNEPWISPHWKGKKNPNEKWFDNATSKVAEALAGMLEGTLEIK